jgi:hypothetical protein
MKVLADNRSYFRAIVEENRDFRPEKYERWVADGMDIMNPTGRQQWA